jgi:hypothetical protein
MTRTTITEKFDESGKVIERTTITETEVFTVPQYPALTYPYTVPSYPVITWGGNIGGNAQ